MAIEEAEERAEYSLSGRTIPLILAYDIVIVGAGSAGCVLANRLSEDPAARVLLLEAGQPDKKLEIHAPAAFSKLFKTDLDWNYETQPQSALDGRRLYWPRGKVLGGSSSINAMIYIRGHRQDYDGWAADGNSGWSYDEVLPYFKRSENFEEGANEFHGTGGPLNVTRHRERNPATAAFVEAAVEAGLQRNQDFNGGEQAGAGLYHLTQKGGKRWSAARAFLHPAMKRPNLTIETGALTTRILFDKGRASGVVYERFGSEHKVSAGLVIVSGGAVNSPHLLLLSGVGPAAELEALGIDVVADLPGVGQNLHDHSIALLCCDCKKPVSLTRAESVGSLARFLLFKQGPLTSNVGEAGGFTRIRAGAAEAPDLQFHFAPSFFVNHGFDNPQGHGLSLGPTLVRPRSRGRLWLESTDPTRPPAIDPRYFSEPEDMEILKAGLEQARDILSQPALVEFVGQERYPGPGVTNGAGIDRYLRQRAYTLYHPVGTCKMGSGPEAVVDSELKVHGIDGLRVVDASIMPTIVNGNTNAPTIMIAEKAAELLLVQKPS